MYYLIQLATLLANNSSVQVVRILTLDWNVLPQLYMIGHYGGLTAEHYYCFCWLLFLLGSPIICLSCKNILLQGVKVYDINVTVSCLVVSLKRLKFLHILLPTIDFLWALYVESAELCIPRYAWLSKSIFIFYLYIFSILVWLYW